MSDTSPQMRASHMRANVASLSMLGADGERIRRDHPDLVKPVERALRVSWLPLRLNAELIEAVEARCGDELTRAWVHASIGSSMKGTLLGPIVDGLVRLGLGPQHGLSRCQQGWNLLYRASGRLVCPVVERGHTQLVLKDTPPPIRTPSYLRALQYAFEGVALHLGAQAIASDHSAGETVEFNVRWRVD
ncbi:MAG: hypothetical protein AAF938_04680 [Myxococcota bacterium]